MSETVSFPTIRNVYCVGRNYKLHAAELGNEVPASPMLFMKPTHAVVQLDGHPVRLPGASGSVHYEAELVVLIGKEYEPGMKADDLIVGFTVGLDLTLRDVQDKLKAKGQPWLAAKGFRSSAPIGRWLAFPGEAVLSEADFGLRMNGREAQRGNVRDMVFGLQQLVDFTGTHYGLGPGDVLFTGTPQGVGALQDGDTLEVRWNEAAVGTTTIKLEA